jgi:tetratricopeptide (TPR) repeat protein
MNKSSIIILLSILLFGCTKMEEKKSTDDSKAPEQQTPMTNKSEGNTQNESRSSGQTDEKAAELSKLADDAISKYTSDKSDENKAEVLKTSLAAGNYLTFEASLPAREKYRPALKYYRKVLEVDPMNEEALKNKNQIEEIYIQMGMPIPK